jgi:hypothetical protein
MIKEPFLSRRAKPLSHDSQLFHRCTRGITAGALAVAQELLAQPHAQVRALQDARDVGDDHAQVLLFVHSQVGHQRGERVVGDLRPATRRVRSESVEPPLCRGFESREKPGTSLRKLRSL